MDDWHDELLIAAILCVLLALVALGLVVDGEPATVVRTTVAVALVIGLLMYGMGRLQG